MLNDREKLIELLKKNLFDDYDFEDLAEELIANGVTVQRWVPVTERLPEPLEYVLVYVSNRDYVEIAYMTIYKEWVGVEIKSQVTHWMQLPTPPKDGDSE